MDQETGFAVHPGPRADVLDRVCHVPQQTALVQLQVKEEPEYSDMPDESIAGYGSDNRMGVDQSGNIYERNAGSERNTDMDFQERTAYQNSGVEEACDENFKQQVLSALDRIERTRSNHQCHFDASSDVNFKQQVLTGLQQLEIQQNKILQTQTKLLEMLDMHSRVHSTILASQNKLWNAVLPACRELNKHVGTTASATRLPIARTAKQAVGVASANKTLTGANATASTYLIPLQKRTVDVVTLNRKSTGTTANSTVVPTPPSAKLAVGAAAANRNRPSAKVIETRSDVIARDVSNHAPPPFISKMRYKKIMDGCKSGGALATKLLPLYFSEEELSCSNYSGGHIRRGNHRMFKKRLTGTNRMSEIERRVEKDFPGSTVGAKRILFMNQINARCRHATRKMKRLRNNSLRKDLQGV